MYWKTVVSVFEFGVEVVVFDRRYLASWCLLEEDDARWSMIDDVF